MLSAGVEAAADLDVEVLDRLVELVIPLRQASSELCCQTPRRSNAEFACIRTRASGYIDNRACSGLCQADFFERGIEVRQVGFAHPAQDDILFHGGAYRVAHKTARDIGQAAKL